MEIPLRPDAEQFIHQQIAAGFFSSADRVVEEALWLLLEHQRVQALRFDRLRQDIQDGLDSGPAEPVTAADWEAHRQQLRDHLSKSQGA